MGTDADSHMDVPLTGAVLGGISLQISISVQPTINAETRNIHGHYMSKEVGKRY